MTRIRMGLVLGLLLAVGVAVAACGGGGGGGGGGGKGEGVASLGGAGSATGTASAGASQDERQAALNWARCMRQHGIDLPDPQLTGDHIEQTLPNREVRNSAKFKAAEQACKQYEPNGGQPTPPSAQERQQALAFARCLRQHGINMPDPTFDAAGRMAMQLPAGVGPARASSRPPTRPASSTRQGGGGGRVDSGPQGPGGSR